MNSPDAAGSGEQGLAQAFHVFNKLAAGLSASYQSLETRVAELNRELAETRQENLRQLREKERLANRLLDVLNALPAGVVVIDRQGVVRECNPVAVELLGEPLEGVLWREIITRAFRPEPQNGTELVLNNGRIVNLSTCPLGSEPGQIIQLVDVTETQALQAAVERYKRLSAMGEMTAKLAHQIRTPLSSAILYLSQLAKQNLAESDRRKFAEKTLARLRHLEHVVEDMLAFTRGGERGRHTVALPSFLEACRQAVETSLEASGSILEIINTAGQVSLHINRDAMIGVVQNLVDNAIQACGEYPARLLLQAELVSEHSKMPSLDLCLRDNGPGIPEQHLARIFEPYFTTRSQGTGLGLAVARSVVEGHGGSIWVESELGKGCCFIMRLPLSRSGQD